MTKPTLASQLSRGMRFKIIVMLRHSLLIGGISLFLVPKLNKKVCVLEDLMATGLISVY